LQRLTELAGGPGQVGRYCMTLQWAVAAPPEPGHNPGPPGSSSHGDSRGSQGGNPPDSPGKDRPAPRAGSGSGGNGGQNGHGGPGPGFGRRGLR